MKHAISTIRLTTEVPFTTKNYDIGRYTTLLPHSHPLQFLTTLTPPTKIFKRPQTCSPTRRWNMYLVPQLELDLQPQRRTHVRSWRRW